MRAECLSAPLNCGNEPVAKCLRASRLLVATAMSCGARDFETPLGQRGAPRSRQCPSAETSRDPERLGLGLRGATWSGRLAECPKLSPNFSLVELERVNVASALKEGEKSVEAAGGRGSGVRSPAEGLGGLRGRGLEAFGGRRPHQGRRALGFACRSAHRLGGEGLQALAPPRRGALSAPKASLRPSSK